MNRLLALAVLIVLGRLGLSANEPAPVPTHGEPASKVDEHVAREPDVPTQTGESEASHEPEKATAAEPSGISTEATDTRTEAVTETPPAEQAPAEAPHEEPGRLLSAKQMAEGTEHAEPAKAPYAVEPPSSQKEAGPEAHPVAEPHATPAADHDPAKVQATGDKEEAHAKTSTSHASGTEHGKETAHGEKAEEQEVMSLDTAELMNYAQKAYEKGRYDMALIAYRQLLSHKMPKAQQKNVLLGYARTLRKKGELTKSVAVYERLVKDFQLDAEAPEIYLELGRTQRALGAYKTAITRFYNVINSTIKLPEDGAARYRQLAKTAQFEIAETYFMAGNYTEASRFYARLRLLDLSPSDRAKAHFKAGYSLQLAGDHKAAIAMFRSYLEANPDDEHVPEAHYQLAVSLEALGRTQEALSETLELLRTEKSKTTKDPKVWAYWQRKTGNQLANDFYDRGNFRNALTIYETLAGLSEEPAWKLPLSYQIALCYERQGMTDKAVKLYQSIMEAAAAAKPDFPRYEELMDLSRMADWRLKQVGWQHATERKLDSLLPPEPEAPPTPAKNP